MNCSPRSSCRCSRPARDSASMNTAGAPAISPSPWRSWCAGQRRASAWAALKPIHGASRKRRLQPIPPTLRRAPSSRSAIRITGRTIAATLFERWCGERWSRHARDLERRRSRAGRGHRAALHARRHTADARWLRAWHLRRLYRARGWRAGERLPDVRSAGAGQEDPHCRRSRTRRRAASFAARLHGASRPAVRLLHPRLPDARALHPRAHTRYRRRGAARGAVVQSLPLHRVPEHPQGSARRSRAVAMKQTFIGKSVPRLEDLPLVTGQGRFAVRTSFPGELHMRIVRSAHAHGKVISIDTAQALAAPGCVAVWTFADVAEVPTIEFRPTRVTGLEPYRQHLLARDEVRYVGEPVAAVFAEHAYLAEDAAELVALEIEPLPVELDAERASVEPTVIHKEYGDVEGAFRRAHTVVELDLAIGRHAGVPLETRAAIARHDRSRDVLELHAATKRPHANRDLIARMLKRSPDSVQLFEGHIGGGFGVRGELYPEDFLVCLAALRLGRPVKWTEDRRENLIACNHSRQQLHKLRAAIDADG